MTSPSNEYELLASLQQVLSEHSDLYEVEIGDDAAVRKACSKDKLIFTADLSVENVHFKRKWMSFHEIGYKAMVTNISDCASMGAIPESALIQLIIPETEVCAEVAIIDMYRGFNEACTKWHFPIIGGDLSRGAQWSIGITMIGKIPATHRSMTRKGAQNGDKLWISGFPGRSAAGLDALYKWELRESVPVEYIEYVNAHIRPCPRVEIGIQLRDHNDVHAMMDLSDGLSKDCRTLAFDNDLGIILDFNPSLFPETMINLGKDLQKKPLEWIINGGEEYELLFATSPSFTPSITNPAENTNFICIGEFTNNCKGLYFQTESGLKEITKGGWDHI